MNVEESIAWPALEFFDTLGRQLAFLAINEVAHHEQLLGQFLMRDHLERLEALVGLLPNH